MYYIYIYIYLHCLSKGNIPPFFTFLLYTFKRSELLFYN